MEFKFICTSTLALLQLFILFRLEFDNSSSDFRVIKFGLSRTQADGINPLLMSDLSINFRKGLTRSFHCSTTSTMAGRSNHDFLEQ
jgi:hypothetical protein